MTMRERAASLWNLNDRQTEVLHLVALGHTNPEISQLMELSQATIKWYVNALFDKLSVDNRVKLARKWIVEVEI